MSLRSFLTVSLSLVLLAGMTPAVHAQTSSPSAELREIIRQRLEQTLNVSTGEQLLGVVGSVTRVSTSTFVLTDPSGRERTIVVDANNTTFAATAQVKGLSDLAIDSGVAVIGTSPDTVLINARRIIPSARPFSEARRVTLGSVESFERASITLKERANNQTSTVSVTTATKFEDILGNTVPRTRIQEDEAVLVVIDESTAGKPFAKRIRLLVSATAE
jgi:hypothetical protein